HDRGWRYRSRLPGDVAPAEGAFGASVRTAAEAAGLALAAYAMAAVADAIAGGELTRRRRHPRMECLNHAFQRRRERQREAVARNAGGLCAEVRADPRHGIHARRRPGSAGDG